LKNDLRLLLDECVQAELAEAIRKHKAIDAFWVNESEGLSSSSDEELMALARLQNRIFVTVENRIDDKRFRICTHPGIIVFRAKRQHDAVRSNIFRLFMLSGQRARSKKAVTYLRIDGVTFRERRKDGTVSEASFQWTGIKNQSHVAKTNYCDYKP